MAAFNAINEHYYNSELEKPVITFKEGKKKKAYGWIETRKQWVQGKNERYDINISVDYLGNRSVDETISTLMHEMAHLYNLQNGIKDTTRAGLYHNKKFKEEAEKHMIKIDHSDKYGWTITSPTDELLEYIMDKGWEDIDMGRGCLFGLLGGGSDGKPAKGTQTGADGQELPKKGNSRRYQCPQCKAIVRATKDLHIICGTCNVDFELS